MGDAAPLAEREDFRRTLRHPEHSGILTVDWLVAMYAWHSRHHVAHITALRERQSAVGVAVAVKAPSRCVVDL